MNPIVGSIFQTAALFIVMCWFNDFLLAVTGILLNMLCGNPNAQRVAHERTQFDHWADCEHTLLECRMAEWHRRKRQAQDQGQWQPR